MFPQGCEYGDREVGGVKLGRGSEDRNVRTGYGDGDDRARVDLHDLSSTGGSMMPGLDQVRCASQFYRMGGSP